MIIVFYFYKQITQKKSEKQFFIIIKLQYIFSNLDKELLAEYLEKKLNIPIVKFENRFQDLLSDDLVKNLPTFLDSQVTDLHKGWIFIGKS